MANPVKIFPGIILRQHRTDRKLNGTAERALRRIKEGASAVLLQSGLDEKWWADSMECYCNLRDIQDLLPDGKTPCERRFGEPFDGPVIPLGAIVECHPISAQDLSRLHQFRSKSLARNIPWICIIRGRNLERRLFGRRQNWKRWTHPKSMLGDSLRTEVLTPMNGEK